MPTLAHLQKLITLAAFAAACGWATFWWHRGHFVIAIFGACFIVLCYAPFVGLEMVLLRATHGSDTVPRASWAALVRAWWGEVILVPRVFYWRQPFCSRRFADAPHGEGVRGLLLVHGFLCNRGFWNPWLARLADEGVPWVAVDLEPAFGSIDQYAERLEAAALQLRAATGFAPLVVGHSMGGLAIRAWLRATGGEGPIHRVITVGTPHQGTWLGRFGRTRNTRQMRRGSDWLLQLAHEERSAAYGRFTCFYSNCDNIVFPPSSATLPGADNRFIAGYSHVHLAFHPEVFDEVMRQLKVDIGAPQRRI